MAFMPAAVLITVLEAFVVVTIWSWAKEGEENYRPEDDQPSRQQVTHVTD